MREVLVIRTDERVRKHWEEPRTLSDFRAAASAWTFEQLTDARSEIKARLAAIRDRLTESYRRDSQYAWLYPRKEILHDEIGRRGASVRATDVSASVYSDLLSVLDRHADIVRKTKFLRNFRGALLQLCRNIAAKQALGGVTHALRDDP